MDKYKPTIGLEIHAELKTETKMFCNSKNDSNEKKPNVNICPVCMAHPGTLPVINKEAVKHVIKVGRALSSKIADFTEFDRKNYFYPDIPKGYQISQYKYPIVSGGSLNNVEITRVHLEEDTARSTHDTVNNYSLVDFNRAGVPLMELVTEAVIHSSKDAVSFAKELQILLRTLGVSDANMEKGEMRVEANISVSKDDKWGLNQSSRLVGRTSVRGASTDVLGTKVEIKNINSFKAVEKAIDYEIKRQSELLDKGGKVIQETRGWDENNEKTFSQRLKEESQEYRYFPDPDLPKLKLSEVEEFKNIKLPELPWEKRERYKKDYGIKNEDIESFVQNIELGKFFEDTISGFRNDKDLVKLTSNYITSDLMGLMKSSGEGFEKVKSYSLAVLINMIKTSQISSRGAKDILAIMFENGGNPESIAKEKGLLQKSDEGELKKVVVNIIDDNPKVVEEYRKGKETVLKFLVGQGMRATQGSANPSVLDKLFKENIK